VSGRILVVPLLVDSQRARVSANGMSNVVRGEGAPCVDCGEEQGWRALTHDAVAVVWIPLLGIRGETVFRGRDGWMTSVINSESITAQWMTAIPNALVGRLRGAIGMTEPDPVGPLPARA